MHEIITLQLGQRSNYLATHFWNTQESYFTYSETDVSEVDPNIHFRPGVGSGGTETFTPRTLIYDLKGGFGTLRQFNALYEAPRENAQYQDVVAAGDVWEGNRIVTHRQTPIQVHQYQQSLETGGLAPRLTADTVRYWSDFNRVFFHPRSIVQLNEYELNSQIMPFENWTSGEELFQGIDKDFDILDRDVRPFAEECDQISALQIFTGADDAWGGFASNYVDRLRDEYGKTSLWTFALEEARPGQARRETLLRAQNSARSLYSISSQSSAYVRLAHPVQKLPPYLHIQPNSNWYNTALSSIALESLTLPSRIRNNQGSTSAIFSDLEAILNAEGNQNIFELSSSILSKNKIPSQFSGATNGPSTLNGVSNSDADEGAIAAKLDIDHSPPAGDVSTVKQVQNFSQVLVSRGPENDPVVTNSMCESQRRGYSSSMNLESYHYRTGFALLSSFPQDLVRLSQTPPPDSISIRSALTCTSRTRSRILALREIVRSSIAVEEREILYSGLSDMSEAYDNGWLSDESEEDD